MRVRCVVAMDLLPTRRALRDKGRGSQKQHDDLLEVLKIGCGAHEDAAISVL